MRELKTAECEFSSPTTRGFNFEGKDYDVHLVFFSDVSFGCPSFEGRHRFKTNNIKAKKKV